MSKFHINPASGAVSLCRAHKGGCPFGGTDGTENHFDSIADARAAYENSMDTFTVPRPKATGLKELNEEIKTTEALASFEKALAIGSSRTYMNMARNPNAPGEILVKALENTSDEKIRNEILNHKNFPVEAMSITDFGKVYNSKPWYLTDALSSSNALTDAHVAAAGKVDYLMLKNPNNKLSKDLLVREAEKSYTNMAHVIESGRYPLEERIDSFDLNTNRSAISKFSNPNELALIAEKAINEKDKYAQWYVASNPATDLDTLNSLASYSEDSDTLLRIYRNPSADESLKEHMSAHNAVVGAYRKIDLLNKEHKGELGKVIGHGSEETVSGSNQKRVVRLNPTKVKELGLSVLDVDTYIRHFRGNYLFGASYNEASGTYTGYID